MSRWMRWTLGGLMVCMFTVVPYLYHRAVYKKHKRFREVTPGVFYRSGQMTVEGFVENLQKYGIRTVINARDEAPDPEVRQSYWNDQTTRESELCRRLGVRFVYMPPDLIARPEVGVSRPAAIDRFLQIMDDPANYPVLVHCQAGRHRAGVLTAVYRMEYQNWSPRQAIHELKACGFGRKCHSANDYIVQYVLQYRPGVRRLAKKPQ